MKLIYHSFSSYYVPGTVFNTEANEIKHRILIKNPKCIINFKLKPKKKLMRLCWSPMVSSWYAMSLTGCSPWGRKELDTTERLHFHFSLSCVGEGNGNPLQCSCLENPRDGGAWWAAISGVAQNRTRLKWLSSSSSSMPSCKTCC